MAVPYKNSGESKKTQVAGMFDTISPKYDFLNHTLSLNIDKIWRRKSIRILSNFEHRVILDVATGTGDFAIAASKLNPQKIVGVDISEGMLSVGRRKIAELGLGNLIVLQKADSENLPFDDDQFDAVIVAFGVRNFESPDKGLAEIRRVLKPGGHILILEFSKPEGTPFKQIYRFYFRWILPMIGRVVSNDKSAYRYLHDSVDEFPSGKLFAGILESAGFDQINLKTLTFGVATIYTGRKPDISI